VVLSYEADGVRWWLERLAASNRSVPPAELVLTWVSSADPALIARRVDDVVVGLESRARMAGWGLGRTGINVYWPGGHDAKPWNGDHYRRLLASMVEHEGDGVDLLWEAPDPDRPLSYYWASNIALLVHTDDSDAGLWRWTLAAAAGLFRDERLDLAGSVFADLLTVVGGWPETTWGAVFHDYWERNEPPPYERYFGIDRPLALTARIASGYYWANLLTEQHLRALGGAAGVTERCAELGLLCQRVGDRDALVVRAGASIAGFDDRQLRAMRELLLPVLDEQPYRRFYAGPPLRVLTQPGTAFRYVPPQIKLPWFEDWPMPADRGMRVLVPDEPAEPTHE
jgi:hypothetical protein